MKIKLSVIAAAFAMVSPAFAANYILSNVVNGDGSTDALIQKADGSLLSGGIATLGYFPVGYVISTNVSDIQTTISNFTTAASTAVGLASASLGAAMPGYMEADPVKSVPASITGTSDLIGRPLYMFVGNSATLAGSTEWALKQIRVIADDVPFEQNYLGNPYGGVAPLIGKTGSYTGDASGFGSSTFQTLQMIPVPETSTALLGALGALGLLRRRR
jgi:hypothetical protein